MGFAIPSQIVQPTVETLIRDGKITHAFIGIQIADVTPDNAKFFQMNKAEGAVSAMSSRMRRVRKRN